MRRVVILGRGGAGKSTLAQTLSRKLDLPVTELDSIFWQPGLRPTPEPDWTAIQRGLVARDRWIIDGDLGPYDTGLALRLRAADTIVVLDFPLWWCAWRAVRRSRETLEFLELGCSLPPRQPARHPAGHRDARARCDRAYAAQPASGAAVSRGLES